VNIDMPKVFKDMKKVNTILEKQGLALVSAQRQIEVLVVTDIK